jgi:dihydrolipoamide dehydrogenase
LADYDLAILGSGPGGYVAAIRAGQLGMRTAIVERTEVGGVCLNWGCIPTKALIRNAEVVDLFKHASEFGISADNVRFDYSKAVERSRDVVKKLTTGVSYLLNKNGVEYIEGLGALRDRNTVELAEDGRTISADHIIIATGARPRNIPSLPVDGEVVVTSRGALETTDVPARAVIVGAGATGAEFAYVWRMYGAEVTLVELMPRLVPTEDKDISRQLERSFKSHGIATMTGASVEGIELDGGVATVTVSDGSGTTRIECDKVLVAVGMQGNVDGIGLERAGIASERDFISVGDRMETNIPGVYAIGDVTGKLLLAHVASAQGVTAVEHIAGLDPPVLEYDFIPRATYCKPQIASFGLTEERARERGHDVKIGSFPMSANGKALGLGEPDGMVKLVLDAEIGDLLGAHMIGPEVTELLGELSMAKLLESTNKELGWLVHPHPTVSEILKEAALDADGEAIHIYRPSAR